MCVHTNFSTAWIRRWPCLLLINHFSGDKSFKLMKESKFYLKRRCALSLLRRAHSVIIKDTRRTEAIHLLMKIVHTAEIQLIWKFVRSRMRFWRF